MRRVICAGAAAVLVAALMLGCGVGAAPSTQPATPTTAKCGKERWAVKTLTDSEAAKVSILPRAGTVAQLAGTAAPHEPASRVAPVEVTTYQLQGTLTFAKGEADSDYHLVLDDGHGHTMIVESPNPGCTQGSVVAAQIAAVRKAIDGRLPALAAGRAIKPNVTVLLTGVGFYDRIHGQTGVAPNGAELHPLLSITFGSAARGSRLVHLVQRPGTD